MIGEERNVLSRRNRIRRTRRQNKVVSSPSPPLRARHVSVITAAVDGATAAGAHPWRGDANFGDLYVEPSQSRASRPLPPFGRTASTTFASFPSARPPDLVAARRGHRWERGGPHPYLPRAGGGSQLGEPPPCPVAARPPREDGNPCPAHLSGKTIGSRSPREVCGIIFV